MVLLLNVIVVVHSKGSRHDIFAESGILIGKMKSVVYCLNSFTL